MKPMYGVWVRLREDYKRQQVFFTNKTAAQAVCGRKSVDSSEAPEDSIVFDSVSEFFAFQEAEARKFLGAKKFQFQFPDPVIDLEPSQPDQPFVMVEGVQRFKANPLVRKLLDAYPNGLNSLVQQFEDKGVTREDIDQFYQLIGYSWGGYQDLSEVSDTAFERLAPIAKAHYKKASKPEST